MFIKSFKLLREYVNEIDCIKEILKDFRWKLTYYASKPKIESIDIPIQLLERRKVSLEIGPSRLN
jgi:hypothetical protein